MATLIIINPHAAGGKAREVFKQVEERLVEFLGKCLVAETKRPEEVARYLDLASSAAIERVIAVGGDGTNHSVLNALSQRPELKMTFGSFPVGTGRDWARSLGVPADTSEALDWLARAEAVPCDLGKVEYTDTLQGGIRSSRIFLNIASAGVSGEVDARVNRARRHTSITFLKATVATLLHYKPQHITVRCDGNIFYKGPIYLLAVANGQYFGRGMWVAPHALINDGKFDVVVVEGMPRRRALFALQTVFSGTHIQRDDVHSTQAAEVEVHSEDGPLGLDFDGEEAQGHDLCFTVLPGAVYILIDPGTAALVKRE